jgi:hypothetical protein
MQQKLVVQKHTHVLQTDSLSCDGLVMDTDWTMLLAPLLVQPTRYGSADRALPDTEQSVDVTFVPMMVSAVSKPLPSRWDPGEAPAAAAAAMHVATARLSTFPLRPATPGMAARLCFLLSPRTQKCSMHVFWSGRRLSRSLTCLAIVQHQCVRVPRWSLGLPTGAQRHFQAFSGAPAPAPGHWQPTATHRAPLPGTASGTGIVTVTESHAIQ